MGRRFNRKRKPKHTTKARYIKVECCNYITFAKGDFAKRSGRSWFSFKFNNVKYKQKRTRLS
ncbi:MAG: hypothetical protein ACRCX2_06455 [Paraclostridium sp.]